jgi:hypothetical protein
MDLIFHYQRAAGGGIYNLHLTIYGSTARFYVVDVKPSTEFVAVRFNPRMAGLFLKLNPINLFQQEAKARVHLPLSYSSSQWLH